MFTNSCRNFHCLAPKDTGSDSEILSANMNHREPVILNVYDMVRSIKVKCRNENFLICFSWFYESCL